MTTWLRILFLLAAAFGAALLIVLVAGGANYANFERYFPILLVVNLFATITLFAFVVSFVVRLIKRWRNKAFGSRMTASLTLMLAITAITPCVLIYLVSSQFIGRSIDSWFDVRIEQALDSGVALSGGIIDREQRNLHQAALRIASIVKTTPVQERMLALDRMREAANAVSAIVFDADGNIVLSAFTPHSSPLIDRPSPEQLRKASAQNGIHLLEGDQEDQEGMLRMRAIVPLQSAVNAQPATYLQLSQLVPRELAERAFSLVQGYRDYQELVLSRSALRNIYGVTLTLTMVLALLLSLVAAFGFARSVTAPVLQLAAGTRKVAEGDLRPIKEFAGHSEINALTRSFNAMIADIAEARETVENQRVESERAREQLERILSNLSSGVLVTDEHYNILMSNHAASDILKVPAITAGIALAGVSAELARELETELQITDDETRFEFELARPELQSPVSLFVRVARMQLELGAGWVIVFDDISTVLEAQRALAWGEVARRLAHEIKNPLTPIRLSAERLEMKLADKLESRDAALLERTTQTIITQVDALNQMVNDFRDFAKLPAANLKPMRLPAFLDDLLDLYRGAGTPIHVQCDPDIAPILGDAAQLRQVMHNILGNAIDATNALEHPRIGVHVSSVARSDGSVAAVRLQIEDNGPGFSPNILSRAFEPYITTKPTGTGLGLPMVKKIIEEHHGKIVLSNKTDYNGHVLGALVTITFAVPASAPTV